MNEETQACPEEPHPPMPAPAPRQAVVIIHGIGEPRPMDTLRRFVQGVTCRASAQGAKDGKIDDISKRAFSKPDLISPTLELRRMSVPGDNCRWVRGHWVSTDFYELYWAHLMTGTSWQHVLAWAGMLLCRWPWKVPLRLFLPWTFSWAIVLMACYFLIGLSGLKTGGQWPLAGILIGVVLVLNWTGIDFGLNYIGDAARYLSPTPANVGVRQAIRSAAVDLLEGLHDDPSWRRYHRIILVGHSLGSVIGYDALTHFWQRRHHPPDTYLRPLRQPYLERYDDIRNSTDPMGVESRELQSPLWREQRDIGIQWKITDFVTLGSPLAHAGFLMAKGKRDLENRVTEREYLSCPPPPHDGRDQQYGQPLLTAGGCKLLHHAAPFACTRWTNLYFKMDFIGGPIEDLGKWVVNRPIASGGLFPHTGYWRGEEQLDELLAALDLVGWWNEENTSTALAAQTRDSALLKSE